MVWGSAARAALSQVSPPGSSAHQRPRNPLHPAVQIRPQSSFTTQHLQSPPSAGTDCQSEPGAERRWQPSPVQPGCYSGPILPDILGGAGEHIQPHSFSAAKRRRAALSQR